MGSYSNLTIDKFNLQWKWYLPPALAFLFDNTEYYIYYHSDEEGYSEEWVSDAGYKTTVSKALSRMQQIGYTLEFFVEIYNDFYEELDNSYFTNLELKYEHIPNPKRVSKIKEHRLSFKETSLKEDIVMFIDLLSESLFRENKRLNPRLQLSSGDILSLPPFKFEKYEETILFQAEVFEDYLYSHGGKIPPGLFRVIDMFDDIRLYEYPDVILLFLVFSLLNATNKESLVVLEYHELLDEDNPLDDLKGFHENMTNQLVKKVTTYNKVFKVLLEKDSWLQEQYYRQKLKTLWESLKNNKDRYKKGIELESFVLTLLDMTNGIEVIDRRLNNGDEEIDIIASNHLSDTFWIALGSPCFLIECKNWNSVVGSKDVRDFEGKLRNHKNLCRIGFFISVNGFSSESEELLKRMGREEQVLVYISGSDIEKLLEQRLNITSWLQSNVIKSLQ